MVHRRAMVEPAFVNALGLVAARFGVAFEPAFEGGADGGPQGVMFELPVDGLEILMSEWRDELLGVGVFPFLFEADEDDNRFLCGLVPTADQLEAVRLVGTEDPEGGFGNPELVAWLETLQREHPFVLTTIGEASVQGIFEDPVEDPVSMAARIEAIAPQSAEVLGDADGLVQLLRDDGVFLLWWD